MSGGGNYEFGFALIDGNYRPGAVDRLAQQTEGGLNLPSVELAPPCSLSDRGTEPTVVVATLMMAFRRSDSSDLLTFYLLFSSLGC